MCSEPDDLRQRASWDGASGSSRRLLLNSLQRALLKCSPVSLVIALWTGYIPPSIMIPQRRFATLLHQARSHQRQRCVYHNSPSNSSAFSLYTDHQCNKSAFPRITTTILEVHTDEVWNMEWSHDGHYLATASKDKTAIIWRLEVSHQSDVATALWGTLSLDHSVWCGFNTGMDTSFDIKGPPILCGMFGVVKGRFYTANQCREPYQTLEHQGEWSG